VPNEGQNWYDAEGYPERATGLCIRWPKRALPISLRGCDNPTNEKRERSHALLDVAAVSRSLVEDREQGLPGVW
jgi:hypothetical protein